MEIIGNELLIFFSIYYFFSREKSLCKIKKTDFKL